jgi:hypothetical protein
MNKFIETLPVTKSEPHAALAWEPATDNATSPLAGFLTLTGKRCHCRYAVEEFPADWGRGFMLFKLDAGSDKTEERYAVFAGRNNSTMTCECKGFYHTGKCKHTTAVATLIEQGQL